MMKKSILVGMIVIVGVLLLVGCQQQRPDKPGGNKQGTNQGGTSDGASNQGGFDTNQGGAGSSLSFAPVCGDNLCDGTESKSCQDCSNLLPPRNPKELYDIQAIKNLDTLQLDILKDETQTHQETGKNIRHLKIRFYSQEWYGVQNWDTANIYIPQNIPQNRKGYAAIRGGAGGEKDEKQSEADPNLDFGVGTAALLDIPVMVCDCSLEPQEYGYPGETALGQGFREIMFDDGDLKRDETYPLTISYMRAMTAFSQLDEAENPTKFITFGSSKRGLTQYSLAAVDDRVKGFVSSSYNAGNIIEYTKRVDRDWGTSGAIVGSIQETLNFFNSLTGQKHRQYYDPYELSELINVPFVMMVGTEDHLFPIGGEQDWVPRVEHDEGTLDVMPNTPHTSTTNYHLSNFRAVIQRVLDGRSTPHVITDYDIKGDQVTVTAKVKGAEAIRSMKVQSASDGNTDLRDAVWSGKEMTLKNEVYTATLTKPKNKYLAFYVEVEDMKDGVSAYTTSLSTRLEK